VNYFEDDRVVVWDTEFTSWPGCNEDGWDNDKGEYKEIIQIGAVLVETGSFKVIDQLDRFVRPQINPELSDYIKNLTGITQEEVNQADKFEEVLEDFKDWYENYNLYSYENDYTFIKRNMELYSLDKEISEEQFNDIRPIFRRQGVPVDEWDSNNIARYFDKNVELLSAHKALHDAKNMTKALRLMKDSKN
jgi:3'-5' exoribonuclease 1